MAFETGLNDDCVFDYCIARQVMPQSKRELPETSKDTKREPNRAGKWIGCAYGMRQQQAAAANPPPLLFLNTCTFTSTIHYHHHHHFSRFSRAILNLPQTPFRFGKLSPPMQSPSTPYGRVLYAHGWESTVAPPTVPNHSVPIYKQKKRALSATL